jgi:Zn-dependent M16 (insulinase) family peptidase
VLGEALGLVSALTAGADFRDAARLRDLVLEMRNDLKAALLPGGTQFAALRAGSRLSEAMACEERWHGVSQLEFLNGLADGIEGRLTALAGELEDLRATVLTRDNVLYNVTVTADGFDGTKQALETVHEALPVARAGDAARAPGTLPPAWMRSESLAMATPVGYASRVVPGFPWKDRRSAQAPVLGHLLTTGTLWEKIRREGGAYGAWAYPQAVEGLFVLGSYRDPKIARTLNAFRAALEGLAEDGPGPDETERAVVGTIGREDRPQDPGEKGFLSLQRRLAGISEEERHARRGLVLACTPADLAAVARGLLEGWERGCTAVLAGRSAIEEAARELPELGETVREVPA